MLLVDAMIAWSCHRRNDTSKNNQLKHICADSIEITFISSPITNSWAPIVAMTSRRSGVGLAVVNGQLYAVGGFDGTAYLKTIEVYDSESNQWRLCGCMNYRRLGGGVGVMKHQQTENSYMW